MTPTASQITEVRRYVNEKDTENFSDDDIVTVIEKYPALDELGEDPYYYEYTGGQIPVKKDNPNWVPTYNLFLAAAEIWEYKAAELAGKFDFSADGGNFSRSQAYNQALAMAKYYRGRGGASTIKLVKKPDEYPTPPEWIGNLPERDT